MDEFDYILDADSGLAAKSFRTVNGYCRIFTDRIELVKSRDDATIFLTSPSFIVRVSLLVLFFGFLSYRLYLRVPLSFEYAFIYLVPAAVIFLSIMGNLNVFLYRLRAVLFLLFFLLFGYLEYTRGNTSTALLYLGFTIFFSLGFFRSFDFSYPSTIARQDIIGVRFINSIPFLTRAYFLVSFRDENGKIKKRPIMLPGLFNKGEEEKKLAVQLMREEGLLT